MFPRGSSRLRLTPTTKCKVLEFHLTGESVLPHVTVLCPAGRNSAGNPVMHFRRVYVGHRRTLPLVLINNGRFPVQVKANRNVGTYFPSLQQEAGPSLPRGS